MGWKCLWAWWPSLLWSWVPKVTTFNSRIDTLQQKCTILEEQLKRLKFDSKLCTCRRKPSQPTKPRSNSLFKRKLSSNAHYDSLKLKKVSKVCDYSEITSKYKSKCNLEINKFREWPNLKTALSIHTAWSTSRIGIGTPAHPISKSSFDRINCIENISKLNEYSWNGFIDKIECDVSVDDNFTISQTPVLSKFKAVKLSNCENLNVKQNSSKALFPESAKAAFYTPKLVSNIPQVVLEDVTNTNLHE